MRQLRAPSRSLRAQLAYAFTGALIIGLAVFAMITLVILHHLEAQEIDSELRTTAHAVVTLVEIHGKTLAVEENDRRQFFSILGVRTNAVVLTGSNRILISSNEHIPIPLATSTLFTTPRIFNVDHDDDRIRVIAIPIRQAGRKLGVVVVWRPTEWLSHLEKFVFSAVVGTIVLIAVPAYFVGLYLARRGLAPIETVTRLAAEIEETSLSVRLILEPQAAQEVRNLGLMINHMLDRLEAAFDRQRRFTADASHELRTPLSVILAEAELALRSERDHQSYRRTLTTIRTVGQELQTLIDAMLQAARAEENYAQEKRRIDVIGIIREQIVRFQTLNAVRSLDVSYDGLERHYQCCSEIAVRQALGAILDNVIRHARGSTSVAISTRREGDELVVAIRDDGPGFTADALLHAQERFWRADYNRGTTGAGLGLYLAASVLEPGHIRVKLSNAAAGGAVVEIFFPSDAGAESAEA